MTAMTLNMTLQMLLNAMANEESTAKEINTKIMVLILNTNRYNQKNRCYNNKQKHHIHSHNPKIAKQMNRKRHNHQHRPKIR